jgi:3-hydroxyisobutyrate dehydrogenase-like beta-hydroxyacid dehydrogenase
MDAQLREIGLGPEGFVAHAKPGSVFVSHTTGTLSTLAELAASSDAPPVILDAPVSGTADNIADGTLTVLVGGPTESVERARPVLAAYAGPIVATGELGTALGIKLINNLLFAANAQLVATAAELGQSLGVSPARLLEALMVCSGGSKASSYAMQMESIASANPDDALLIEPNFFTSDYDRKTDAALLRTMREIFAQSPIAERISHETFPGPGVQSDDELIDSALDAGYCGYHAVGTCAMGPGDDDVVDDYLRVRGIERLHVVDCSIMPTMVAGNLHGPIMAMAWRAADMIAEDRA